MPQLPAIPSLPSTGGAAQQVLSQPLPGQPTAVTPTVAVPLVPAVSPEVLEERRLNAAKAHARDASCDSTVACAKDRMDLWQMVQISDPSSVEGRIYFERAQRDLAAAQTRDDRQAARDEAQNTDLRNQLRDADRLLRSGDYDAAESIVDEVLRVRADNEQARSIRQVVEVKREQRRTLIRVVVIVAVSLIVIALLVWLAIIAVRKHRAASQADAAVADTRRATLQVVDGVGRGRSATLSGDVFHIGATAGDEGTRNDMVLSDADARISRFHCNVMKKDGRFFLIDTSSNGTTLNGTSVPRGERRRIKSGDPMVLAESGAITLTVH